MQSKLKVELFERRESQYALAARVGISETRLSRIIQGRVQPTAAERVRIAEALEMPESELFEHSSNEASTH